VPQDTAQGTKKKWLLFMILAPGIFFVFYWLYSGYSRPVPDGAEIPETYVELGERVLLDGNGYRAFHGDKLFSDRVELQNNLAIAEPGRVFVGLGIAADNGELQGEVTVIDSLGSAYAPLEVKKDVIAGTFGFADNAGAELFMFKVNSKADSYFLKLQNLDQAWIFANTYRNP